MSILVRHAMTSTPQTVSPDLNAADAAGLMKQEDIGALPVVRDGELVGLVTDRDLVIRVLAERRDPMEIRVGDVMTKAPITVTPDMRLSQARDLMAEHAIRRLPVVKADQVVGILSLGDVAWADASTRESGETLRSVSESASTTSLNEDVPRGTPERVRHAREGNEPS
jgi:CBS domain-containing protein